MVDATDSTVNTLTNSVRGAVGVGQEAIWNAAPRLCRAIENRTCYGFVTDAQGTSHLCHARGGAPLRTGGRCPPRRGSTPRGVGGRSSQGGPLPSPPPPTELRRGRWKRTRGSLPTCSKRRGVEINTYLNTYRDLRLESEDGEEEGSPEHGQSLPSSHSVGEHLRLEFRADAE
eukprot:9503973-Pyramimonas_sp.AAC.1